MADDQLSGFYVFGPAKRPWALQLSIDNGSLTLGIWEADGTCRDIAFLRFEVGDEPLLFLTLVRIWAEKLVGDGRPHEDMLWGLELEEDSDGV